MNFYHNLFFNIITIRDDNNMPIIDISYDGIFYDDHKYEMSGVDEL